MISGMISQPTSPESLAALRRLRKESAERGDECLSVLLAGVDLFLSIGRESELLEIMRESVGRLKAVAEATPTVEELERLYRREHPED